MTGRELREYHHRINVCNWVLGYICNSRRTIEDALRTCGTRQKT